MAGENYCRSALLPESLLKVPIVIKLFHVVMNIRVWSEELYERRSLQL